MSCQKDIRLTIMIRVVKRVRVTLGFVFFRVSHVFVSFPYRVTYSQLSSYTTSDDRVIVDLIHIFENCD